MKDPERRRWSGRWAFGAGAEGIAFRLDPYPRHGSPSARPPPGAQRISKKIFLILQRLVIVGIFCNRGLVFNLPPTPDWRGRSQAELASQVFTFSRGSNFFCEKSLKTCPLRPIEGAALAVPEQRGGMEAFAGTPESGRHGGVREPHDSVCRSYSYWTVRGNYLNEGAGGRILLTGGKNGL